MDIEGIIEMIIMKEIEVGLGIGNIQFNTKRDERSDSRSTSGLRASTKRDRIRCYTCREYVYFAKDCPTLKVEKESEQTQQMDNMDKEQTKLKILTIDTYDSLNKIKLTRGNSNRPFKHVKGKNGPTSFLP